MNNFQCIICSWTKILMHSIKSLRSDNTTFATAESHSCLLKATAFNIDLVTSWLVFPSLQSDSARSQPKFSSIQFSYMFHQTAQVWIGGTSSFSALTTSLLMLQFRYLQAIIECYWRSWTAWANAQGLVMESGGWKCECRPSSLEGRNVGNWEGSFWDQTKIVSLKLQG